MTPQMPRLKKLTDRVILYKESDKNNIGTEDSGVMTFKVDFQRTS